MSNTGIPAGMSADRRLPGANPTWAVKSRHQDSMGETTKDKRIARNSPENSHAAKSSGSKVRIADFPGS
jgi:hypothetical protein